MGLTWRDLDQAARAELRQVMSTSLPMRPRAEGMVFDNTVAGLDVPDLPVERVTMPTLVVAAQDSTLPRPVDVAAVVARLPAGRVLAPATGGHVLLGNVEPLRAAITAFLFG
jgi:2-hydroxy-6-oxonona-2,4-dienedioate hydrolase